jgi:hypothetical protein
VVLLGVLLALVGGGAALGPEGRVADQPPEHEIPGLVPGDQLDPANHPNQDVRNASCVPTAEAISLWHQLKAKGKGDVNGDAQVNNADLTELIRRMIQAKRTDATGTSLGNATKGIKDYLKQIGEGQNFSVQAHANGTLFERFNQSVWNNHPPVVLVNYTDASGNRTGHALVGKDVNYTLLPNGSRKVSFVDPWGGVNITTYWWASNDTMLYDIDSDGIPDWVHVDYVEKIDRIGGAAERAREASASEWLFGHVVHFGNGTDYVMESFSFGEVYVEAGVVHGLIPAGMLWGVVGGAVAYGNGSVEILGVKGPVTYDVYIIDGNYSWDSAAHYALPSMPLNLVATPSGGTDVELLWDPPLFPRGPLLGYRVYRTNSLGQTTTLVAATNSYTDTVPSPGNYWYSVAAVNGNGVGPAGPVVPAPNVAPQSIGAMAIIASVLAAAAVVGLQRRSRPSARRR